MNNKYVTAKDIAVILDGMVIGNPDERIYGITLGSECKKGYLTYVNDNFKYEKLKELCASAVILPLSMIPCDNKTYIMTPYSMYEKLYIVVEHLIKSGLYSQSVNNTLISDTAKIDRQTSIGKSCLIGDNTLIEAGVRIGDNTVIGNNCVIKSNAVITHDCEIGNNVTIDNCVVIGKESIEMCCDNEIFHRIPSVGKVIIGDNVEIDANAVIERGTIGNTVIGSRTKIDSLVRIGHEAKIGDNCKIISLTAIAGWAEIGSNSVIYGQCGVSNMVRVGEYSTVMARSGVTKSIPDYSIVSGVPAQNHYDELKLQAFLRKIFKNKRR